MGMMNLKRILILSYKQTYSNNILRGIYQRPYRYKYVILGNSNYHPNFKFSENHSFFNVPYDFEDEKEHDKVLSTVVAAIQKERIDIIVPSDFESLKLLNFLKKSIVQYLSIMPMPSPELIDQLDHKSKCHSFFLANDIPTPKTEYLPDVEKMKTGMRFPFLIKSVLSAGGKGIKKIYNRQELEWSIKEGGIKKQASSFILQEFVDGIDYCFNGFAYKGKILSYTIFRYIEFDNNKSKGSFAQFFYDDEVFSISKKILSACNYSGPIVIDFVKEKLTDKIYCIEINPRFGNNTHYSLIDGVDFLDIGIKSTQDQSFFVAPKNKGIIPLSPKRLFSAPLRKFDFRALNLILSVGIPYYFQRAIENFNIDFFDLLFRTKRAFLPN